MDPYKAPSSTSPDLPARGKPCLDCGSTNTGSDRTLQPRPSVISVIFFGWVAILARLAFSKKTEACRDCGASHGYRTAANNIALSILIVIVLLIVLAYFGS